MSAGPTFDLELIKNLVRLGEWTPTKRAAMDASRMDFDPIDIRDCVLDVAPSDFFKTAESDTRPGTMQDVYKPIYCGTRIYLKLQVHEEEAITRKRTVVISFHECD
jgi:hypothetical protein